MPELPVDLLIKRTVGLDPLDVIAYFAMQALVAPCLLVHLEVWALVHHRMMMTMMN
jgi:hypothetical protein